MKGLRAIVLAGLTCGVLDGISAVLLNLYFGATVIRTFQGIASGAYGRGSFQGGTRTALMGVVFHFIVATGAATVYYIASRGLPVLMDQAMVCGVVFGALVHLFMTFVVIPMSAIGRRPVVMRTFIPFLLVSMIVVGPSIALSIRRYSR